MAAKTNYLRIGIFIAAAIVIVTGLTIFFGAGDFFQKEILVETYIDGSVKGLTVGSSVLSRGVKIGNVKQIEFVDEFYQLDENAPGYLKYSRYIRIVVSLDIKVLRGRTMDQAKARLDKRIKEGLRARLTSMGITGMMSLQFDYIDPDAYAQLEIAWTPTEIYIPSAPSLLSTLEDSVEKLVHVLGQSDIVGMIKDVQVIIVDMHNIIEKLDTSGIMESITKLLDQLQVTIADTGENLPETIKTLDQTLSRLDIFLAAFQGSLPQIMENVTQITTDLKQITSDARQYPSKLLFGDPPPKEEK